MKTIVVNSGCQSFGIAAALRAIFPACAITANPLPAQFDDAAHEREQVLQLAGADVWITSSHAQLPVQYVGNGLAAAPTTIAVPMIGFSAFQPDICYAVQRSTGTLTQHHYNSAIAVWAYRQGVLPEDAQRLFTTPVFRDLGYYALWEPNVAALRDAFAHSDLADDFDTFFLHIQRTGNFMYSVNHPRITVLTRLAKIIALRLGCTPAILAQAIEADDFLAQSSWPMYPEVARQLSLPGGGYQWKINAHTRLEGLRDYLDFAYAAYQSQGIAPQDLAMYNRDDALYDRVLGAALRGFA